MVAILILIIIKLGGDNIKKKKSSNIYRASDNGEASERRYKKLLEANERAVCAIYNSLAACIPFGFYLYEWTIFSPVNPFNNKLENNKIDKLLKNQDQ